MMLSRDLSGSGAMLARLVQLGARAGLNAEATLLHVLDGAPLPELAIPPASVAEIVERIRGINHSGADAPAEAPMAVDGVGEGCATALLSQSDDILPAGFNGEGSRVDAVPDVLPEGADDTSDDVGLCFEFPEASRPEMQDRLDALNAEAFARELGLPDLDGGKECAERDAGSSDPGGDVAAFPAPPAVQPDEPEMGIASPQQSELDPPAAEETAARPAGPGPDLSEQDHIGDAAEMDPDPAAESGVASLPGETAPKGSHDAVTGGESAAEAAGAIPPVPAAAPRPKNASAEIERLWRDTLLKQVEIGDRVGKSVSFVGAIISQKRKKRVSAILVGDQARLAAESERLAVAAPAAPASPVPAEPQKPVAPPPAPHAIRAAAAAPANGDAPPDDLALIAAGRVLVIDRGWIVGPTGNRKGFALINSVLDMLSTGEPVEAEEIAKACGVRASAAVLKQLEHWKDDLAGIGVEVIRMGGALVSLRRSA